jgi:hypothetical protein
VQFRTQPTGVSSAYDGRVEHLVSGQEARFHSLEELLAFMVRVLTDVQRPSGADWQHAAPWRDARIRDRQEQLDDRPVFMNLSY